jgi:hypothetical protein
VSAVQAGTPASPKFVVADGGRGGEDRMRGLEEGEGDSNFILILFLLIFYPVPSHYFLDFAGLPSFP